LGGYATSVLTDPTQRLPRKFRAGAAERREEEEKVQFGREYFSSCTVTSFFLYGTINEQKNAR
jgi:hypothetical protein